MKEIKYFHKVLNVICVLTGNEQVQQRREGLCRLFGLRNVCSIVYRNPWKNYQRSPVLKSEDQIAKDPRGDNQIWLDRREKFQVWWNDEADTVDVHKNETKTKKQSLYSNITQYLKSNLMESFIASLSVKKTIFYMVKILIYTYLCINS